MAQCDAIGEEWRRLASATTPAVDEASVTRLLSTEVKIKQKRIEMIAAINKRLAAYSTTRAAPSAMSASASGAGGGAGAVPLAPPPPIRAGASRAIAAGGGKGLAHGATPTAGMTVRASSAQSDRSPIGAHWHTMLGSSSAASGGTSEHDSVWNVHSLSATLGLGVALPPGTLQIAKRRENLTKEQKDIFKRWFLAHLDNPYPTEAEKGELAAAANTTKERVTNWFINARARDMKHVLHEARDD